MVRTSMGLFLITAISVSAPLAAKAPPAPVTVTGPAVNCVTIRNIRDTKVIDDRTIDFHMSGNQVFRNTLPNSCPQLGFQQAFAYRTSTSELCSVDIITVIVQGSGSMRGASCGLGKFTPISLPARK